MTEQSKNVSNRHNEPREPAAAKPGVDLSQLAFERQSSGVPATKTRRRWFTRYAVPLGILAAFASLFAWAARDSFLPAQQVTITPVFVTRAEVQQEGTPLFQAAGWIEPRPTAMIVPSLAVGVVQEMLVVEGQSIEKGRPVAKLIDVDAKIAVQQAEANLRLCDADVKSAEATLAASRTKLANPNELRVALADAESLLAETNLTLGNLPYVIEAADTRRQLATDNVSSKEQAGGAIAGRMLREAKAEQAGAESALAELQARRPTLEIQLEALQGKRSALKEQLELMTEPKRAVAEAEAALAAMNARRDQAQLALDIAHLNLERMVIVAPISGRVLTVDARPGRRLVGMDPLSQQDSSAVISLYDPQQLQVRVDVRLEDVPHVQVGQPVSITTAAISKPLTGEVLWVTTRADIQKNTLQVKVAINDPPAVISPEMLGQVVFLAPPQQAETAEKTPPLRLLIPRQFASGTESGSTVWLADMERGIAHQQAVQFGKAGTNELVEVTSGLQPTDKLIAMGRESVTEGTRIRIVGEDQSANQATRFASHVNTDSTSAAGTQVRSK